MTDMSNFNQTIIDEFRANHGVVGGGFAGAPLVLLTTTGAKSGATRTNPLVGQPHDDGTIFVFASAAGSAKNPDWFHNLVANPDVEVEFSDDSFSATATVVSGDQRDQIYAEQVAHFPDFGEYEKKTTRTIPVVALHRKV
jgi:deazaflavin-dependent oxidoreductase (nitroreductase family)